MRYASFREFQNYNKTNEFEVESHDNVPGKKSPKEILENAHAELNASLSDDWNYETGAYWFWTTCSKTTTCNGIR